ncbi:cytochrome c oxidase assembly protein [Gordonia sp. HNM0687]|uniref:Cytochrome c oxidase assembly protein n=1 Tax=Gordonia mangrovi TaxID=2665643 RepID=A0A6L7GIY2_9ACTN|nr:cytochrome c oxidase assembly protein [Gordonia mangrovi]
MVLAHGSSTSFPVATVATIGLAAVAVVVYCAAAHRRHREARGWNHWRTASFLAGMVILAVAVGPATAPGFGSHMLGHLLIGMFAPLAIVLSAPVTLLLRSGPPQVGRFVGRILRSSPAHLVTNPIVLLVANIGGLAALYFSPLFAISQRSDIVHTAIHIHFFVVGYLFAWLIAGPDPGPGRPGVRVRLVVLGVAIAGHAVIAQLLYAGAFVAVDAPADEIRAGGTLMYYWGDIAEILLALALLLTWRPDHRQTHRPIRPRRSSGISAPAPRLDGAAAAG